MGKRLLKDAELEILRLNAKLRFKENLNAIMLAWSENRVCQPNEIRKKERID